MFKVGDKVIGVKGDMIVFDDITNIEYNKYLNMYVFAIDPDLNRNNIISINKPYDFNFFESDIKIDNQYYRKLKLNNLNNVKI